MPRDPGCKFRKFYFSSSSIGKVPNLEEISSRTKVTGKKQNSGWNPSAYRVKSECIEK